GIRDFHVTGVQTCALPIYTLSWAVDSLIVDGRGMSDTKQGVTLEIFGEGWSMGPLDERMKADAVAQQGDIHYPIEWTTLGEYLEIGRASCREQGEITVDGG